MKKKLFESIWMCHIIDTSNFLIDLNSKDVGETNFLYSSKKYTNLFSPEELCLLTYLC